MTDTPTPDAARNGHKIVVIDGHALAFRSYYAIRDLSNSRGETTNAVYGFLRSLLRILAEEGEFDATVVTFDAPAKTFRHEQFEGYKAGRREIPDDLPRQIKQIKQLVELLGLHQIEQAGLEADDLIGTIATRCAERGYHVEIVTSDRDAYQLVGEHITVRGLSKNDRFGPDEVLEKFGVTVAQWIDFRALTGDPSDNIPGAKGIGPKTAAKLLQEYGTLEHILTNLETVKPESAAKKVAASIDDVRFSHELSRIVTDADIDISPERWAKPEMQREALAEFLWTLEFGSLLRELGLEESTAGTQSARSGYRKIPSADIFFGGALGYVLSSASPMSGELIGLAVASAGTVAEIEPAWAQTILSTEGTLNACDAKALAVFASRSEGRAERYPRRRSAFDGVRFGPQHCRPRDGRAALRRAGMGARRLLRELSPPPSF